MWDLVDDTCTERLCKFWNCLENTGGNYQLNHFLNVLIGGATKALVD